MSKSLYLRIYITASSLGRVEVSRVIAKRHFIFAKHVPHICKSCTCNLKGYEHFSNMDYLRNKGSF